MPKIGQRPVRVSCSGWNYASWKDEFYEGKPPRLWLQHYARVFDTVEVNNTFYRLPLESSVARWVEETPTGFVFAVKSSRYLTHVKRLTDLGAGVERYYERLRPLVASPKLGPTSASITDHVAGTATTASANWKSGHDASRIGAVMPRSMRTSTTTGRCSHSGTPDG